MAMLFSFMSGRIKLELIMSFLNNVFLCIGLYKTYSEIIGRGFVLGLESTVSSLLICGNSFVDTITSNTCLKYFWFISATSWVQNGSSFALHSLCC